MFNTQQRMYNTNCVGCKHKYNNCHKHCLVYKVSHLRPRREGAEATKK